MSQDVYSSINPATTSGTQLADALNKFKDALMSGLSGTSRPAQLTAGGTWVDTSMAGTPNFYWMFKIFDGTTDIEVFRLNLTTGSVSISSADTSFQVVKISDDTVGAIFKLIKARVANSGRVNGTDVVGELQYVGTNASGTRLTVARIKAVATENYTGSANGSMLTFEYTPTGSASIAEAARILNGNFGVGTTNPISKIHALGATGIRSENISDDAVGAQLVLHKARLTTPQLASADVIGQVNFKTTDNTGAEATSAQLEAAASEAHSSTALGTTLALKLIQIGSTVLSSVMTFGAVIETILRLDINSLLLKSANVATSATITALNASKAIIHMTGSTTTSIQGILSTSATQVVVIHNRSSATVTLKNEDAGATAADRLLLPNTQDIEILPNASAELFYSPTDARWKVKSGSGSGGGALRVTATQTLTSGGTIASSTTDQRQLRPVQGTTEATLTSTTPFGTGGAWKDGTEMVLTGMDNDATVLIPYNDAANGCVGPFDQIELKKYGNITFIWHATAARWVLASGGM